MVRKKFNPDCFNSDVLIRVEVARQGRPEDLDQLANDPTWQVQEAVAKHGRKIDLDKLIVAGHPWIKKRILFHYRRPEDLDALVSDPDWRLRMAVAECGRPEDLDRLVDDSCWPVRLAVARHGLPRHLKILVNDPEDEVWLMAIARLKGLPLPQP